MEMEKNYCCVMLNYAPNTYFEPGIFLKDNRQQL